MIITHIGHAEFLIELNSGYRIVIDPYDSSCGYPVKRVKADAVLVSHRHHDHCAVEQVENVTKQVDSAGEHTLEPGITVSAFESYHDSDQGAKRGKTLLFRIDAEGLRIVHLGDLGCIPDASLIEQLVNADVIMIPVGGFYTIDAREAKAIADLMNPTVVIPMHYRTEWNADWPIASVDDFVTLYDGNAEYLTQLRITAGDRECQPALAVLEQV